MGFFQLGGHSSHKLFMYLCAPQHSAGTLMSAGVLGVLEGIFLWAGFGGSAKRKPVDAPRHSDLEQDRYQRQQENNNNLNQFDFSGEPATKKTKVGSFTPAITGGVCKSLYFNLYNRPNYFN